ncbi:S-layer homology domain-containing protein [Paenibacillus pectinilyticus]|uniref:S-layer homology domain-containing protein n=1 Tax=Paenibacillus pectinilyticus TaxID=512399 RepID=UPI001ABF1C35|nr:S-layer homology domain-containing protein [Paenibacillus pectinilyticus]
MSFRKSHAPNELVFTEAESTLRSDSTQWTVTNVTYNNRLNEVVGSPIVTKIVTSTGEENLSVDLSTIFRSALSNGRKVISIHLTTAKVDDTWAAKNGIINGTSHDWFSPNDSITREQMAIMLYNYLVSKGYKLSNLSATVFTDGKSVSPWAKEAVDAIAEAGILIGKTGGYFDPKTNATRAEVAVVFARFIRALSVIKS